MCNCCLQMRKRTSRSRRTRRSGVTTETAMQFNRKRVFAQYWSNRRAQILFQSQQLRTKHSASFTLCSYNSFRRTFISPIAANFALPRSFFGPEFEGSHNKKYQQLVFHSYAGMEWFHRYKCLCAHTVEFRENTIGNCVPL